MKFHSKARGTWSDSKTKGYIKFLSKTKRYMKFLSKIKGCIKFLSKTTGYMKFCWDQGMHEISFWKHGIGEIPFRGQEIRRLKEFRNPGIRNDHIRHNIKVDYNKRLLHSQFTLKCGTVRSRQQTVVTASFLRYWWHSSNCMGCKTSNRRRLGKMQSWLISWYCPTV